MVWPFAMETLETGLLLPTAQVLTLHSLLVQGGGQSASTDHKRALIVFWETWRKVPNYPSRTSLSTTVHKVQRDSDRLGPLTY